MDTPRDISRSVFLTIEQVKQKYRESKFIKDLEDLDAQTKRRSQMEGRELATWNAQIYRKKRNRFNLIVRKVCKANGRNEDHIRRIAGWKRGNCITNVQLNDKD